MSESNRDEITNAQTGGTDALQDIDAAEMDQTCGGGGAAAKPNVTFRNLPVGSYSASYKAQVSSNGSVRYQTGPSRASGPFSLP